MPTTDSADCVLIEPTELVLRGLRAGKMASFYVFSDSTGKKVGLVAMKATNEQAQQATKVGTLERKKRGFKRFCRGLIVRDDKGDLVFVRYTGTISAKHLEKLLNRRMGKSTDIDALIRKHLRGAAVQEKETEDALGKHKLAERLPKLGVNPDAVDEEGDGQTVRALLEAMEADILSEDSFQEEFDEMIRDTLQPIATLLGVELRDTSPKSVSGVLLAAMESSKKSPMELMMASPEATEIAQQVLEIFGEGLGLMEDPPEEMGVLGYVRQSFADDLATVVQEQEPEPDVPAQDEEFTPIYEDRVPFGAGFVECLFSAKVKPGMTWAPDGGEALEIQPLRSRTLNELADVAEDLEEGLEEASERRENLKHKGRVRESDKPEDLAARRNQLADEHRFVEDLVLTAQKRAKRVIDALEGREDPIVVSERHRETLERNLQAIQDAVRNARVLQQELRKRESMDARAAWVETVQENLKGLSIPEILENPTLNAALLAQARSEFCEENVEFLNAARQMSRALAGQGDGPAEVRSLVEEFLTAQSEKEVNLKKKQRNDIINFVDERADEEGLLHSAADKAELRARLRPAEEELEKLVRGIYDKLAANLDECGKLLASGVSLGEMKPEVAALVPGFLQAGEMLGLSEPGRRLIEARKQAADAAYLARLWEEMQQSGQTFLRSKPKKAHFILSPRTKHEGKPMILLSAVGGRHPLLSSLTGMTEEGRQLSSGELVFHHGKGRLVAITRPGTPAGLSSALRALHRRAMVTSMENLEDEESRTRKILDTMLDNVSMEDLVGDSDPAARESGLSELFREYGATRLFVGENVQFLEAVHPVISELKADIKAQSASPRSVRGLYDRFLSVSASTEVNIPSEQRLKAQMLFESPTRRIIDGNGAVTDVGGKVLLLEVLKVSQKEISNLERYTVLNFQKMIKADQENYYKSTRGKRVADDETQDSLNRRTHEVYKRFAAQHGIVAPKG